MSRLGITAQALAEGRHAPQRCVHIRASCLPALGLALRHGRSPHRRAPGEWASVCRHDRDALSSSRSKPRRSVYPIEHHDRPGER